MMTARLITAVAFCSISGSTLAFCPQFPQTVSAASHWLAIKGKDEERSVKFASAVASGDSSVDLDSVGKVSDPDRWVLLASLSLEQFTGRSMLNRMKLTNDDLGAVHAETRFGVLSHGIQPDPIFHYFNKAALAVFQQSEPDIYALPSRYAAPPSLREQRDTVIRSAQASDIQFLDPITRVTAKGDLFVMHQVILWNVYDETGHRIGQTAMFDRELVVPVKEQ